LVQVYTDGSSDEIILNGGAGIHISLPNGTTEDLSFGTGKIACNFTSELMVVLEALR